MLGRFKGPLPLLSVHPIEKHSRATPGSHVCPFAQLPYFAIFEKNMKTQRWSEQGKCGIGVHLHNAATEQMVSRPSGLPHFLDAFI